MGPVAGKSPPVCMHRNHVGCRDNVQNGAHEEVHFYVIVGTVCKGCVHDATLKIEVILFLLHDTPIQTS